MREDQSDTVENRSRRNFLRLFGVYVFGVLSSWFSLIGATKVFSEETAPDISGGEATVTSFSVDPEITESGIYYGCTVEVGYETENEHDYYLLPPIYFVSVGDGARWMEQQPAESFDPGTAGQWEMGFTSMGLEGPATVVVHIGGHKDSFEVPGNA